MDLGTFFIRAIRDRRGRKVDGNLPDVPVNDLVIDPTTRPTTRFTLRPMREYTRAQTRRRAPGTTWNVLQSGTAKRASAVTESAQRFADAGCGNTRARRLEYPTARPSGVRAYGDQSGERKRRSGDTQITATGNGFTQQSVVNVEARHWTTTYVNATTLDADVPASATPCGGTLSLNVTDPTAGTTNALPLGCCRLLRLFIEHAGTGQRYDVRRWRRRPTNFRCSCRAIRRARAAYVSECAGRNHLPFSPNPVTPTTAGASVNRRSRCRRRYPPRQKDGRATGRFLARSAITTFAAS